MARADVCMAIHHHQNLERNDCMHRTGTGKGYEWNGMGLGWVGMEKEHNHCVLSFSTHSNM
jgi:hypothetical protein